jgi:hypothetical protein
MTACSGAFLTMRPCAVMVLGIAGTMPVHGIGTARFYCSIGDTRCLLVIHNCLFCHGEDCFHLLSVSQMMRTGENEITFSQHGSRIMNGQRHIPLIENEGLYELRVSPAYMEDSVCESLPLVTMTMADDGKLWDEERPSPAYMGMRAPSKLGIWQRKVLWTSCKIGIQGIQQGEEYETNLQEFCESYFVPPSQPEARKTYRVNEVQDMADLSLRFMGIGTDRLRHTLERSRGLTPASKKKGENISVVPPHNFPQGKWKAGKTPRVSKHKVSNLHKASIAEACFTDTFETGDSTYRYGQAVVDYRSRYGDIFPIRTRKKVAWAVGEFCCRHFTPLILIRDNIAENIGGELEAECHRRGIKSAFICPYIKQQNYSEGYLGRVTTMASFAMVLAGAPLFMWRWAIQTATFIDNIAASYYKKEGVWATPWELVHGEPFPDASIVIPFGCAALVLLNEAERSKFKGTCVMMIFIHYALDHPLYTYALYSPRTKRVIYRQDVIFLPTLFPMREARLRSGLLPDGADLVAYRSPKHPESQTDIETSFQDWKNDDPLPLFQDDVCGYALGSPPDNTALTSVEKAADWPSVQPFHPSFGPRSAVKVSLPWRKRVSDEGQRPVASQVGSDGTIKIGDEEENTPGARPKRTVKCTELLPAERKTVRRPVGQRWYYEPVKEIPLLLTMTGEERRVHNTENDADENGDPSRQGESQSPRPEAQCTEERRGEDILRDQRGGKTSGSKDDVEKENKNVSDGFPIYRQIHKSNRSLIGRNYLINTQRYFK